MDLRVFHCLADRVLSIIAKLPFMPLHLYIAGINHQTIRRG
jgi:hypothetical protein